MRPTQGILRALPLMPTTGNMTMLRKLISWLHGRRIGETRYVKDLPWLVGNPYHLLPTECWTDSEKEQLKLGVRKQTWDGYQWVSGPREELTIEEFNQRLKT